MHIIIHCKSIKYDCDLEDLKTLPKKIDYRADLEDIVCSESMESSINEIIDDIIADRISDETGFCIKSLEFTWEWDPADLLKALKKKAKKVLNSWRKEHQKLKDKKIKADEYLHWIENNISALGFSCDTNQMTGMPIAIDALLAT